MLDYLRRYRLNRAIKSYVFDLAPALNRRYGMREQYSVLQIKKTARHLGLEPQYLAYAVALYRHEASENSISLFRIGPDFLQMLRREIADGCFHGDTSYRPKDVLRLTEPVRWGGTESPNWLANYFGHTSL
jgi:hypothetical protein